MGRLERSWKLIGSSWGVLRKDKELVFLPVISGVVMLVVCATFVLGTGVLGGGPQRWDAQHAALGLAFYVVSFAVAFFFQCALVAGALERLGGGDPTLGSCLRAASRRLGPILMWSLVAGTVGMLLRMVQEKSEIVGKIVAGLLGVVWSLATYFMVPVLVMEGRPVNASFHRSWAIFKQTWGETMVGNVGLGLLGLVLFLAVAIPVALLAYAGAVIPAVILGAVGLPLVMVITSSLSGIYLASLYRYATTGEVAPGFDRDVLADAFVPKAAKI